MKVYCLVDDVSNLGTPFAEIPHLEAAMYLNTPLIFLEPPHHGNMTSIALDVQSFGSGWVIIRYIKSRAEPLAVTLLSLSVSKPDSLSWYLKQCEAKTVGF